MPRRTCQTRQRTGRPTSAPVAVEEYQALLFGHRLIGEVPAGAELVEQPFGAVLVVDEHVGALRVGDLAVDIPHVGLRQDADDSGPAAISAGVYRP